MAGLAPYTVTLWATSDIDGKNVAVGESVYVRNKSDESLANLYSDENGQTPINQPLTSDSLGQVSFYVDRGTYLIDALGRREIRAINGLVTVDNLGLPDLENRVNELLDKARVDIFNFIYGGEFVDYKNSIQYASGIQFTELNRARAVYHNDGTGDAVYVWAGNDSSLPFTTTGNFDEGSWHMVQRIVNTENKMVKFSGQQAIDANRVLVTGFDYPTGKGSIVVKINGTELNNPKDATASVPAEYTEQPGQATLEPSITINPTDEIVVRTSYIDPESRELTLPASSITINPISGIDATQAQEAIEELVKKSGLKSYDSFEQALLSDSSSSSVIATTGYYSDTGLGKGIYLRRGTGAIGDTDGGSYLVDAAGNRFELYHQGTVSIEQFGSVNNSGSGSRAQKAVDYTGATRVVSERPEFELDFPVFLSRRAEIDMEFCHAIYTANTDVYAALPADPANAVRVDRSVGLFNIRGQFLGNNTSTVTSSIVDGTNKLTLDDVSWLAAGDDVLLEIVYPRKNSPAFMFATVEDISGNEITTDYQFGWEATSCVVHDVDAVDGASIKVGKITDNGGATTATNYISGVCAKYAKNYTLNSPVMENAANPAVYTRYTSHCTLAGGSSFRPREVGAGRGYSVQINESNDVSGYVDGGTNTRHVLDLTGAAHCDITVRSVTSTNGISQVITHGAYEHDNVIRGGYQNGGGIGVNLAASDFSFGKSTKRTRLVGMSLTGRFRSQYAEDITLEDIDFIGDDMAVQEIELGGHGDLTCTRIKCKDPNVLVRVRPDQDVDTPRPMGKATFNDCDFASELRFTYYNGDIALNNCDTVEVTCSQITGYEDLIPKTFTMNDGNADMRSTWNRVIASKKIEINGTNVHSDATDRRIRCQAPVIKVDADFSGGAGIDATSKAGATDPKYICQYFLLNGVTLTDALNNMSPHFTHENSSATYPLTFMIANSKLDGTGVNRETVDFVFQNNPQDCVKVMVSTTEIFGGVKEDFGDPAARILRADTLMTFVDNAAWNPF